MCVKMDSLKTSGIFKNQTWINQKEKSLLPLPILIVCNEKSEWSHYCCSKHFLHNNIDCNSKQNRLHLLKIQRRFAT